MITLQDIQKRYKMPIPRRFKLQISEYITDKFAQDYIRKALDYSLDAGDNKRLFKLGSHNGYYPKLYWLCFIYIHPLTIAQSVISKTDQLIRSL